VEAACTAALECGVPTSRFVRRYCERQPGLLTLRQVDPLIRQLTLYRDRIDRQSEKEVPECPSSNSIARSARSASPAWPWLEARLRQAQAERLAPRDLLAALVTDELVRRQDRLLDRRRTHARFRDPGKTLDTLPRRSGTRPSTATASGPPRRTDSSMNSLRPAWRGCAARR
jgi:hypothetical protein